MHYPEGRRRKKCTFPCICFLLFSRLGGILEEIVGMRKGRIKNLIGFILCLLWWAQHCAHGLNASLAALSSFLAKMEKGERGREREEREIAILVAYPPFPREGRRKECFLLTRDTPPSFLSPSTHYASFFFLPAAKPTGHRTVHVLLLVGMVTTF